MKAQLLKLLTIFLISLAVISPVLVFWKIWQCHSQFVNAQRIVLSDDRIALNPVLLSSIQNQESSPTDSSQQQFQPILLTVSLLECLGFIISVALGFCSGLMLNNFYQTRRDLTLRQQVATLEKIWQQSIY
jgi:ABC-type phosphate transport system permease subunit